MPKIERVEDAEGTISPLRITKRKGCGIKDPSIRVKCGCCDKAVVIYHGAEPTGDPSKNMLEINGVLGTVDQWRKVLLPLLGSSV